MRERKNNGCKRSSHHAGEEQLEEPARTPRTFKRGAKHPDAEHVSEPMPEADVNEAVGDNLPDCEMENHFAGHEAEVQKDPLDDCPGAERG